MRPLLISVAVSATALLVLATAFPHSAPAATVPSPHITPDPGKAIFQGKGGCFACHGMNGEGGQLGPDLTDDEWLHFEARPDLEEMKTLVKAGVAQPAQYPAAMPPLGGASLSDEELTAVAEYVLSL